MAKDMNDVVIVVGDIVNIPCVVTEIPADGDYVALKVTSTYPVPGADYTTDYMLNSKQVKKE